MTFPQQYNVAGEKAVIAFNALGRDLIATLPPPATPVNFRQPFVVGTIFVINNTGNTLSVYRTVPTGAASNPPVPIPPRFSMPIVGWFTADMWLAGDGTEIGLADSVTIYCREDLSPFNSASIVGSGPAAVRNWYLPNGFDTWGYYGHLVTESVGLGTVDPANATVMNNQYTGYTTATGTYRVTNPLAGRAQVTRIDTAAAVNDVKTSVGTDGMSALGRCMTLGISNYDSRMYSQRILEVEAQFILSSNLNVNIFIGYTYPGTTDPFLGVAAYASGVAYQPDTGPGPGANPDWKLFNVDNSTQGIFDTGVVVNINQVYLIKATLSLTQLVGTINGVKFGPFTTRFPSLVDRLVPRLSIITREAAIKTLYIERHFDWVK